MANITFSSPVMAKDVTVYAIAGHRGTILAKANKIPIPFDCQDGECGSCLIEVKNLTPGAQARDRPHRKGKGALEATRQNHARRDCGRGSERHAAALACQYFVRDEQGHELGLMVI